MLYINEIFQSIQGESSYMGRPCVFVRFSGCNLNCKYCDTAYAADYGKEMTVKDIIRKINKYTCSLVELTGGEPLLQDDIYLLISELLKKDYQVLLETNGTIDLEKIDKRVIKIMDIKCPASGESEKNNFNNLKHLTKEDEIKFVITQPSDYRWAKEMYEKYCSKYNVIFTPVYEKLKPQVLANWIIRDKLNVRLGIQLHKYIGVR